MTGIQSAPPTLAKAPFAFEIACEWMESKDVTRRRCAYGLFYELSKKKNVKGMDDAFLIERESESAAQSSTKPRSEPPRR